MDKGYFSFPVYGSHQEQVQLPAKSLPYRASSPARMETVPVDHRINEAILAVLDRCMNDPQNQRSKYARACVQQNKTVLAQKWITFKFTRDNKVWVRDDPISFEKYDRRLNTNYPTPPTQYGPITKQMHLDINLRPPIVDDLHLEDIIEEKRTEVLWGHLKEKIEKQAHLPLSIAQNIALYAMAGMVQNFEGPSINRIKRYARETFRMKKLINPNDSLEVSQANMRPRIFTTQVIGETLHVIGTNWVALKVCPSDLTTDPYTLGTIMTMRKYSISLQRSGYHAHRQPDIHTLGE